MALVPRTEDIPDLHRTTRAQFPVELEKVHPVRATWVGRELLWPEVNAAAAGRQISFVWVALARVVAELDQFQQLGHFVACARVLLMPKATMSCNRSAGIGRVLKHHANAAAVPVRRAWWC